MYSSCLYVPTVMSCLPVINCREEDEVKSLRHRYLTVLKRSLTAWKQVLATG